MTREELQAFVDENYRGRCKSGVHCRFYKLPDGTGLKTYTHKDVAAQTLGVQSILATRNYAPKCWGYCELNAMNEYGNPIIIYCYLTEVIDMTAKDLLTKRTNGMGHHVWEETYAKLNRICFKLLDKAIKCFGLDLSEDMHTNNFGFKGTIPMFIDVGYFESVSEKLRNRS